MRSKRLNTVCTGLCRGVKRLRADSPNLEFSSAQSKEQHTQKEYQASVEEHKRLHSSTEQAKAAYDKAQQDVGCSLQFVEPEPEPE